MAGLSHNSKWYAVDDAKVFKLTADPAGGTAAYATGIDVPGIKTVAVSGSVNSNELRGDGKRLDQASKLTGLALKFEFAKSALDLFNVLAGGTVTDTGSSPAQVSKYARLGSDQLNYFKFEAQTLGVDTVGGDGHIILYKCILTSFPELGMAEEDYKTYSVEAAAMPLVSNDSYLDVIENETAVAIAVGP